MKLTKQDILNLKEGQIVRHAILGECEVVAHAYGISVLLSPISDERCYEF